jgi:hypothetical protein
MFVHGVTNGSGSAWAHKGPLPRCSRFAVKCSDDPCDHAQVILPRPARRAHLGNFGERGHRASYLSGGVDRAPRRPLPPWPAADNPMLKHLIERAIERSKSVPIEVVFPVADVARLVRGLDRRPPRRAPRRPMTFASAS